MEVVAFKSIGPVVTRNLKSLLVPFRKKEFERRVEDTGTEAEDPSPCSPFSPASLDNKFSSRPLPSWNSGTMLWTMLENKKGGYTQATLATLCTY